MLVLRVCHLFSYNQLIQGTTVLCFSASVITSSYFMYQATKDLQIISSKSSVSIPEILSKLHLAIDGCQTARPKRYWRIFLPALILHTLLYVLTAFRALRNRQFLKDAPILKRLLRDGGFFFATVFGGTFGILSQILATRLIIYALVSVALTIIGAFSSAPTVRAFYEA